MLTEIQLADDAPWKRRFRVSPVRGELARNRPERGAIFSNRTGRYELYAWDRDAGSLTQVTDRPNGTLFGFISPDGEYLYYLDDTAGDECGHFVRVPFAGGEPQDVTPGLPLATSPEAAVSGGGERFVLSAPGPEGFSLYAVDLRDDGSVGEARHIHTTAALADSAILSEDGELCFWSVTKPGALTFGVLAFDLSTGDCIAELWDENDGSLEFSVPSPIAGDTRLASSSDGTGVRRPLLWDGRKGERVELAVGELEGDVVPWEWTPDASTLLLCQTVKAAEQLWLYDLAGGGLRRLEHGPGAFDAPTFLSSGDLAVRWQDSTHPARFIVLDGESGRPKDTLLRPDEAPPGRPWRSVSFPSSDEQEIQAWLAVPEGAGPHPTILETHGGPTMAQFNVFSAGSQAWLDHGFAYCSVNYRGSTTFGREFERTIWGDLGHWEVEDMAAAYRWLVAEGIAQPDAVLLTGWSYGGYLTLHALGRRPELWAGGMGGVVVADFVSQYEDESEMLRGYDVSLFGGTLEEQRELYVKSSPITYLEHVRAPVLIIQGRNDTRDPPRQVELYESRARELGKEVEIEWFETGHAGSAVDRELAIAHQALMLRFAYRVLGRRGP